MRTDRIFKWFSARRTITFFIVFIIIPSLWLGSCVGLDRSIDPFRAHAYPANVCPGDSVSLSWDTGDGSCLGDGCPPPVTMSIVSDPAGLVGSFNAFSSIGGATAGPITTYSSFTFTPRGGGRAHAPLTSYVRVILPDRENIVPFTAYSYCSGSAAVYDQVILSVPTFRSEGVRITNICATSSETVTVALTFENGSVQTYRLDPCIMPSGLPAELGRTVVKATLSTSSLSVASCESSRIAPGRSSSLPPNLSVNVHMICDLGRGGGSASEPIVAATDVQETATSDLVSILPTDTSTPATIIPTLTLLQNAFCRKGPGTVYEDVTTLLKGQQVQVDGQNDFSPRWWWVLVPGGNQHCWVSDSTVEKSGPVEEVPIQPAPPAPTSPPAAPACSEIISDAKCNSTPGCSYDYVAKKCVQK